MKQCCTCKKYKPLNEFTKNKSKKDGYAFRCKSCKKSSNKIANKKIHKKYKRVLNELKSNGCAICGYDKYLECLDFHHVNPEDKKFCICSNKIGKENKILAEEINKCILLCCRCHREIHIKELES